MIFTRILNTLELIPIQNSKASTLQHKFGSSKLPFSTIIIIIIFFNIIVISYMFLIGPGSRLLIIIFMLFTYGLVKNSLKYLMKYKLGIKLCIY